MPLALTNPRWNELRSSYGDTGDIVAWLTEAYEHGFSDEREGDLINEVQHQRGTSTAMYAVATHLIALARLTSPEWALRLLTDAGIIYANSGRADTVPCPEFLREEFIASASEGAQMLTELLPLAVEFDQFKWAVAGLAGFMGHDKFARFLDGLDLHEGRFHHILLDGPFPSQDV